MKSPRNPVTVKSAAARYGINLVVVVNNNSGFGQNLTGVRRVSGNRPGRGEELIRFGPTDFTKVAAPVAPQLQS